MCKRLQFLLAAFLLVAVPHAMAQDGDYIVIDDFEGDEIITINPMANGPDESPMDFELVENPLVDDVNPSATVMRFRRSFEGDPWAGFWSALGEPIDMTEMKYVHVHVMKPRVSPVRFKVEGGTTDPSFFEIEPVEPQSEVDQWQVLTFHFENAAGEYPTIAFMPDFEDPLTLTEDIEMYFDNIILSSSAEPPLVVSNEDVGEPRSFTLSQNHPNPFVERTRISYSLDQPAAVRLRVFNALGQEMARLVDGVQAAGSHNVMLDGSSFSSGVYFYTLESEDGRETRSMVVVR